MRRVRLGIQDEEVLLRRGLRVQTSDGRTASALDHLRADLVALAQVRGAHTPVFSLYLDLRPERREAEPPLTRFRNLLRRAEQQIQPDQRSRIYREHWAQEADRSRRITTHEHSDVD
jgi:hypothetical protein